MLPQIIYSNDKPQNPYLNGNGNRNSGSSMDDFSDFFKEFGLDDDDINTFLRRTAVIRTAAEIWKSGTVSAEFNWSGII